MECTHFIPWLNYWGDWSWWTFVVSRRRCTPALFPSIRLKFTYSGLHSLVRYGIIYEIIPSKSWMYRKAFSLNDLTISAYWSFLKNSYKSSIRISITLSSRFAAFCWYNAKDYNLNEIFFLPVLSVTFLFLLYLWVLERFQKLNQKILLLFVIQSFSRFFIGIHWSGLIQSININAPIN